MISARHLSLAIAVVILSGVFAVGPAAGDHVSVGGCPEAATAQQGWFLDEAELVDLIEFFGIPVKGNKNDGNGDGYLCFHYNSDMSFYWTVKDDKDEVCPPKFALVPTGELLPDDVGNKNDANGNGLVCALMETGSGKDKFNVRDNTGPLSA